MLYPAIATVMKGLESDSRYTLVIATAKRARQIAEGAPKLTECKSDKSVTIAIYEIADGKIIFTRDTTKWHHNRCHFFNYRRKEAFYG